MCSRVRTWVQVTYSALMIDFLEGLDDISFSGLSPPVMTELRDPHWDGEVVFYHSKCLLLSPCSWFLPWTGEESSQKRTSDPPSPSLGPCPSWHTGYSSIISLDKLSLLSLAKCNHVWKFILISCPGTKWQGYGLVSL